MRRRWAWTLIFLSGCTVSTGPLPAPGGGGGGGAWVEPPSDCPADVAWRMEAAIETVPSRLPRETLWNRWRTIERWGSTSGVSFHVAAFRAQVAALERQGEIDAALARELTNR